MTLKLVEYGTAESFSFMIRLFTGRKKIKFGTVMEVDVHFKWKGSKECCLERRVWS